MPQVYTSNETYHAILVAGLPLFYEFEADGTIWPGYVVMMNAPTEGHVVACTHGSNPVGVADIAMASQTGRGSVKFGTCTTHSTNTTDYYATGDQVKVISGPVVVTLVLDASENVVVGEKVQCAATAGMVEEYACLTTSDPCALVAEALETATTGLG